MPVGQGSAEPPGTATAPHPKAPGSHLSAAPRQHGTEVRPGIYCDLEVPRVAAVDVQHGAVHLRGGRQRRGGRRGPPLGQRGLAWPGRFALT